MYNSIPHIDGLTTSRDALRSLTHFSPTQIDLILELVMFILENNCFEFKGTFYRQVRGTAMGSPFAPAYANIYMAYLWNNAIATQLPCPVWLKRFLDDIITLVITPVVTKDILCLLNSAHSSTKFTISDASCSQSFLDTLVCIKHGKLHTDLYSKPTDSHRFLTPTSCHPRHIFRSIVYSGALRIRRICSMDEFFVKRIEEFRKYLISSGYRENFIDPIIEKVVRKDRRLLVAKSKVVETSDRVVFVTTHDPKMMKVTEVHNGLKHILGLSERMERVLPAPPLVALRRPPNIGNAVIRTRPSGKLSTTVVVDETQGVPSTSTVNNNDVSMDVLSMSLVTGDDGTVCMPSDSAVNGGDHNMKETLTATPSTSAPPEIISTLLTTNTSQIVGHLHCGQNRCLICKLRRTEGPTVTSCSTGMKYRLQHSLNCNSECVVYSISCAKCRVQYVGKTVTKLRTRFNNHKSTIRKGGHGTVDKHFNLPGHDIEDVRIQAIDKCNLNNILARETWWIHRLKSLKITDGLNVDPGVKRLHNSLYN